jgi:hypothetical protein
MTTDEKLNHKHHGTGVMVCFCSVLLDGDRVLWRVERMLTRRFVCVESLRDQPDEVVCFARVCAPDVLLERLLLVRRDWRDLLARCQSTTKCRFLTAEGVEYLREYLHVPAEIVPATLKSNPRR